jgi:hypothetical protein
MCRWNTDLGRMAKWIRQVDSTLIVTCGIRDIQDISAIYVKPYMAQAPSQRGPAYSRLSILAYTENTLWRRGWGRGRKGRREEGYEDVILPPPLKGGEGTTQRP